MIKQLVLFLFLVSILSCKQEENPEPGLGYGTVQAMLNNTAWEAKSQYLENNISYPSPSFVFVANILDSEGYLEEFLAIRNLNSNFEKQYIYNIGLQLSDSAEATYGTFLESDVIGDGYETDSTATNNFFQITSYNSAKAEIEGVFNVSLILTKDGNDGVSPPQNLVFTNGTFTAKVERAWFE